MWYDVKQVVAKRDASPNGRIVVLLPAQQSGSNRRETTNCIVFFIGEAPFAIFT